MGCARRVPTYHPPPRETTRDSDILYMRWKRAKRRSRLIWPDASRRSCPSKGHTGIPYTVSGGAREAGGGVWAVRDPFPRNSLCLSLSLSALFVALCLSVSLCSLSLSISRCSLCLSVSLCLSLECKRGWRRGVGCARPVPRYPPPLNSQLVSQHSTPIQTPSTPDWFQHEEIDILLGGGTRSHVTPPPTCFFFCFFITLKHRVE